MYLYTHEACSEHTIIMYQTIHVHVVPNIAHIIEPACNINTILALWDPWQNRGNLNEKDTKINTHTCEQCIVKNVSDFDTIHEQCTVENAQWKKYLILI